MGSAVRCYGTLLWQAIQGNGLGRRVIEELLHTPPVVGVEQVY